MASKERPSLTSIETARPARLDEAGQRERQQQLARQLAVNAEVRRRWADADQVETFQSPRANESNFHVIQETKLSDYLAQIA